MTESKICTCPSGDGSLRWPCPAHPAVEQAGGDERAAFEQWLEQHMSHHFSPELDLAKYEDSGEYRYNPAADYWKSWQARAALAQPSPMRCLACGGYHGNSGLPCPNMRVTAQAQPSPAQAEQHWPKLEKPAQVGAIRFSAGVSSRLVVEAAQRLYEFESTPEQEAERIERLQAFREQLDPLNLAPHAEAFNEAPADALRPEQAEAERPEVVAVVRAQGFGRVCEAIDVDTLYQHCSEGEPLMTVAQHERIVGALRAEITQLRQHKNDYMDAGQETYRALQNEIREREAEIARLDCLVSSRTAERDAAQARVAGLEAELETERMRLAACGTAALGYFDGCADAYKSASLSDVLRLRADCDSALARVAELEMLLRKLSTNGLMQFSTVDEEMAVQAALGGALVAQAQQLHDLDKQCRDDVARALGLRPNQERGFAWSYLLTSIKSCVKASEDSAQAQHSVPEEFSFEYRHPNGESHTVTVSRDQVINEMPDFLFEALCSKFCNCEPVGETNVVECCCDEYAEEFKLLAAAPGKEVGHE
ncbi:hypothetical protein [Pseudomonas aeruginosa]|uniref:hypothetical protein n=1 Tax=Pseudomonas aeruginosa TaxID=287 RepID=UPI002236F454|nr:hypothetical protein [Pseudomonas aeruginosa]MCW4650994.1 hypothetical protein [Pseudomonas aeruginosa]